MDFKETEIMNEPKDSFGNSEPNPYDRKRIIDAIAHHNGKARRDSKGSTFGLLHRLTDKTNLMFDIDNFEIGTRHVMHKEDTTYVRYKKQNGFNFIFPVMFEIKYKMTKTLEHLIHKLKKSPNDAITAQVSMCKQLNCRYFIVVENNGSVPVRFFEINTTTLEAIVYKPLDISHCKNSKDIINAVNIYFEFTLKL